MNAPVAASLPPLLQAALRPLPLAPLTPLLGLVLRAVLRRHPAIFDRLGGHAHKRFGLQPTDLPFALVLAPHPEAPRVAAVRRLPRHGIDARISGPLRALVALAEGEMDGDALFVSRTLTVEGDMEAVIALRNAMDGEGLDLVRDVAAALGPFSPLAERLGIRGRRLIDRLSRPRRRPAWN
jgi:predicted lipid carrier protein YhbT